MSILRLNHEGKPRLYRVLPFPPTRRIRVTPVEVRLRVLETVEPLLRELQRHQQATGQFDKKLSLILDWLDTVDEWERPAA